MSLDKVIQDVAEEAALKVIDSTLSHIEKKFDTLANEIVARMKASHAPDDILNTTQVAEYLGVTPQTIANWRNKGINLTYHMQEDKVKYLFSDVQAFKNSMLGKKITPKR